MTDTQIVDLYFARNEAAIIETDRKYGKYCRYIANRILNNDSDSEEIVNDTYLKTWNTVPPIEPDPLKSYVGLLSNQLALNRYYENTSQKRGGGEVAMALDELTECVSGEDCDMAEDITLQNALNSFLRTLPRRTRRIFVRRYWYLSPIDEITSEFGISENAFNVLMHRTREKLREYLEKEGIAL